VEILKEGQLGKAQDAPVTVQAMHFEGVLLTLPATYFGYAADRQLEIDGYGEVPAGSFFCLTLRLGEKQPMFFRGGGVLISHYGQQGHRFMQGAVDLAGPGHVKYIDNCTDSLLVCPPRLGDPCLNALYFPPGVDQTYHTHPSLRAGMVIAGEGEACFGAEGAEQTLPLKTGDVFYLPTGERHRFRTLESPMTILAFHPDSDFGPTDENHPMINRTIV
jgi:quercetin dioxygenase-like cupin family protein